MGRLITFSGCEPCTLRKEWQWLGHPQMPVACPTEATNQRVLVVGEAPGETEDDKGLPFVGKTGRFLRDQIPYEWKHRLYWSNTVRCRPPSNRKPTPEEIQCCSTYQERDFLTIRPQAILAVGDYALKYFWPTAWVTGMRGIPFPVQLKDGTPTWCTAIFHPRYVMESERKDYDTGGTTNPALPVFRNDILKFFDSIDSFAANPPTIYTPPKNILYPKTEEEVYNLFDRLKEPYAYDIETFKLKPYKRDARIITAAYSDGDVTFSFPVNWPGGINPWGLRAYKNIMLRKKRWIAQHAGFEYIWTWSATNTCDHEFEDIEVLARLHHKRAGLGSLDDLSRIYLGIDIKALLTIDKNRLLDYPVEKVLEYNALDAWSTYLIYCILMQKVSDNDLENYFRLIETCKTVVASEVEGLHVDIKETENIDKDLNVKLANLEAKAQLIPEVIEYQKAEKKLFQISAPEQVGHVLVMYCGIQLPKTPKGTQYSTNEDDLAPLVGKHPLVDLTLEFREIQKLQSTYVTPILMGTILGADGLLHPSYTTVHTRTYRLSSEDPNIQNFPKRKNKHIRKQLVAKPGHIFAAFDYGQLEARCICMYSGDKNLTLYMAEQAKAIVAGDKAKIKQYDIHYKWLYRIIDVYPAYMDRLARNSGETTEDGILKAGRTIIKTDWVFASFYGSRAPSLSSRTGIPINIVEKILDEFWGEKEGYIDVKKWIDSQFAYYQEHGEVQSLTGRARNEVLPGNEVINCVDYETEVLTQRGWMRGNELEKGDILLTMNPITHLLEWQACTDVKQFPNYEGQVYNHSSKSFSAVTTPQHRWLIEDNGCWYERTSETLPDGWGSIPRVQPYSYPTKKRYSDNLVRLVGWVLTDGFYGGEGNKEEGYAGSQVGVCQCKPDYIPIIDSLFDDLREEGVNVRTKLPKNRKKGEEICWHFSGNIGRWLRGMFPHRILTSEFLLQLPISQLKILFETMMFGDGSKKTKNSSATFSCRSKEGIDNFQILAYLCGEVVHVSFEHPKNYPSQNKKYKSMNNIPNSKGIWIACILTRKKISLAWVKDLVRNEKIGMWCPMVPNTFFVARREGKPFITGNTPNQGLAAEIVTEAQNAFRRMSQEVDPYYLARVNIHDDLMFEFPDSNDLEQYISITGQEVVKPRFSFINVPLMTECRIGPDWYSLESVINFVGETYKGEGVCLTT